MAPFSGNENGEGMDKDIGKDGGDTEDEDEASKPNDSPSDDEVSKFTLTFILPLPVGV